MARFVFFGSEAGCSEAARGVKRLKEARFPPSHSPCGNSSSSVSLMSLLLAQPRLTFQRRTLSNMETWTPSAELRPDVMAPHERTWAPHGAVPREPPLSTVPCTSPPTALQTNLTQSVKGLDYHPARTKVPEDAAHIYTCSRLRRSAFQGVTAESVAGFGAGATHGFLWHGAPPRDRCLNGNDKSAERLANRPVHGAKHGVWARLMARGNPKLA